MNLLFVCSQNEWRSPTAEAVYKNHPVHQAKSAGIASSARIKLTAQMIEWADLIFVMEDAHKRRMAETFGNQLVNKPLIVLHISSEYRYMDPELVEMIKMGVDPYLE